MGIFSDDDISKIEAVLVLAGKDKAYRGEFLAGFHNNWKAMGSQKIDLRNQVHQGIDRIPERLKELKTARPLFVGKDIGTLIGMLHFHPAGLLKEDIIEALIPPLKALNEEGEKVNGVPIFHYYIRHLMGQWEVEVLKQIKNKKLTGNQIKIFQQYRSVLCFRDLI